MPLAEAPGISQLTADVRVHDRSLHEIPEIMDLSVGEVAIVIMIGDKAMSLL